MLRYLIQAWPLGKAIIMRSIIILKMRKYMRDFSFLCVFFWYSVLITTVSWYQTKYIILKIPYWTTVLYSTCKTSTCRTQANSLCSMSLEHYKRVIEC